jgi:NAD(P)-dependent dehydrogenase (short-subunit alcohol dehydrogenase family)
MTRKGFVPYGPSRAGSEALSCVMAADLKDFGITVNILLPGGPVDKGFYGDGSEDFSRMPVKPLDVGIMTDPILFLASPLSDGMTGERIIAREFDSFLKDKGIVL